MSPAPAGGTGVVLHVLGHGGALGGAEVSAAGSLVALRQAGIDARVLLLAPGRPDSTAGARRFLERDVPVSAVSMAGKGDPRGFWAVRRTLRTLVPSLVHTHGERALLVGAVLLVGRRTPWVHTVHAWVDPSGHRRRTLAVAERLLRCPDRVIAVSAAQVEAFEPLSPGRVRHVPNPLPGQVPAIGMASIRSGWGIDSPALVVGWVGRLEPEKDPLLGVEVARLLQVRLPGARVVMVGAGALEREARRRAGPNVVFAGAVGDAMAVMPAFDLLLSTSPGEGDPLVVAEAASASVPAVAAAVPGLREAIVAGRTGVLVGERNAEALAGAVVDLLQDPDRRKALGAAARLRVAASGRGPAEHARALLELYRQAGARRSTPLL